MSDLRELAKNTYNRAFELVVEGNENDALEGLELAATSLHAWKQVGTKQNEAIGFWLYSRALTKAGASSLATQAARDSLNIAQELNLDWMIASALEALTRATRNIDDARIAKMAIEAIADHEDRALIAGQFADLESELIA
jgi:hypothetical protein